MISAHRGLSAERVENTVRAFEAARDAGFDGVELDVRVSGDHEIIIIHDAGIERTHHGNGRVADMDFDEIRTYESQDGPIPRLADAFDALEGWDGHWNIEVKAHKAAAGAAVLLREHGLADRCMISSMDPRALELAKEVDDDIPRGLIVLGPPDDDDWATAQELACTWLNADKDFIDKQLIDDAHARGMKISAWTVNDPQLAKELRAAGVDCIITDTRDVLKACQ